MLCAVALATALVAALCAVAPATPTGQEYCYISNHDDMIYLNNVCTARPNADGTCFMTVQSPPQTVQATMGQRDFVFPKPVPDLDEVTVVSCNASYGFNITCIAAPMMFNAPPTSVCALRSDDYNDVGHVVNNTVTFTVDCHIPQMDCSDVPEIEFYTDLHCSPNAFIPGSGLQCQRLQAYNVGAFGC